MDNSPQADQCNVEAKISSPDKRARYGHQQHAPNEYPEQNLLPAVVLALFRHVVVVAIDHFLGSLKPFHVDLRHCIQPPEAQRDQEESDRHQYANKGIEDAGPNGATEEL